MKGVPKIISAAKISENIRAGKTMFFRFHGNTHHMWQEGVYEDYKRLKIPVELENKWREELFEDLKKQFLNKKSIHDKVIGIGNLLDLGVMTDSVVSIIECLLREKIDTFSKLLLCEELKRIPCENEEKKRIISILENQKQHMLSEDITVDEKYLHLSYMKDYDFSNSNIKKRIGAL